MSKKKKENLSEGEVIEKDESEVSGCDTSPDEEEVQDGELSEVDMLKAEIDKLKDSNLRTMAEYDNFRKRTAKEKLDIYNDAVAKTVLELLPAIDNFERALDCDSTDGAFKEGMEMIFSSFHDTLKKLGVEEIEADGAEFDPDLHHAIKQVEIDGEGDGIICEVYQKGYKLGDKVIRHAMVVVANP